MKIIKWIKEGWIRRFILFVATWRRHRECVKTLNMLTDRDLKDIGLSRCDIDRLIWQDEDKTLKGRGKND